MALTLYQFPLAAELVEITTPFSPALAEVPTSAVVWLERLRVRLRLTLPGIGPAALTAPAIAPTATELAGLSTHATTASGLSASSVTAPAVARRSVTAAGLPL